MSGAPSPTMPEGTVDVRLVSVDMDGTLLDSTAVVPDARHIAVGPQGVVTFVGTRKDAMWAITSGDVLSRSHS